MIPDYLKLPPELAIKLLRSRVALPIDFTGLDARLHDYAFMITGLMRADMLEETKKLLVRSLEEGTSQTAFAENLEKAIAGSGWSPSGKRVELIFNTNINKSYWQGKEAQMTAPAMLKARPLWLFRHRDSPMERKTHKALHNKAIPADHPFWKAISFPISFGCRCSAFSVTEDYCKRNGIEILTNPPDPQTLIDSPSFRRGTDKQSRQQILKSGLDRLSPNLRSQVQKELKRNGKPKA